MWVCPECGSPKVQEQRWVDVNTGEQYGQCDEQSYWC
jgi:hypothetical protein